MGSGFKNFTATVLTASDVNNFLMEQSVMSFVSNGARDVAITAPEEGMVAVLTADDLMTIRTGSAWVEYGRYGAWESYTPTWTNLTVGNGTVTSKYVRIGSTVIFLGKIVAGSTTSVSGFVNITLPITAVDSLIPGTVRYNESGVRSYVGTCNTSATGNALTFSHSESGGFGSWNAANPFTIGDTDTVSWNITYEAA
jgi:hypothetical protein